MRRLLPMLLGLLALSCDRPYECTKAESEALFEKRIGPILRDERPASCNQCHLSGIDLSNYVQETPCQTMACLADKELVDLDQPSESVVLTWISRAQPDSSLITQQVIDEEYDAFLSWIEQISYCGDDSCALEQYENPCGDGPSVGDCDLETIDGNEAYQDPGDCSDRTLEELFLNRVYAWAGRCYPCHWQQSEIAGPAEAPKWIGVGPCENASLETLRNVEQSQYVNLDDPEQSLFLLKPLAEEEGGVMHGGHAKFHSKTEDVAYLDFLNFAERYAACKR